MSWMLTNSGMRIDLPEPSPDQLLIQDIAHHLSLVNRFTGATTEPYSVACHSLCVSAGLRGHGPEMELVGLMHDAPEAYLGDVSSPLKALLPEYKKIEATFWRLIAEKWGMAEEMPKEVKWADKQAYLAERNQFMPWRRDLLEEGEVDESFPQMVLPLEPKVAEQLFLDRFYLLQRQIDENNYNRKLPNINGVDTLAVGRG